MVKVLCIGGGNDGRWVDVADRGTFELEIPDRRMAGGPLNEVPYTTTRRSEVYRVEFFRTTANTFYMGVPLNQPLHRAVEALFRGYKK